MSYPPLRPSGRGFTRWQSGDIALPAMFPSYSGTPSFNGGSLTDLANYNLPQTSSIQYTFGSETGTGKWYGGVLAPNGYIYGVPQAVLGILIINPLGGVSSTLSLSAGTAGG